jgi:hypothetical protein
MKESKDVSLKVANTRNLWLKKQEVKTQRRAYIYALNYMMKELFDSTFSEYMRQKERLHSTID